MHTFWVSHPVSCAFDPFLQQSLDQKCLLEKMTITNVRVLKSSFSSFFHLPSKSSSIFLFFVLYLLQSSIKFPSRSEHMLPVRARQQIDLAASTTALHSACVIVASSGSTFATWALVFPIHFFCVFLNPSSNLSHKSSDSTVFLILSSP